MRTREREQLGFLSALYDLSSFSRIRNDPEVVDEIGRGYSSTPLRRISINSRRSDFHRNRSSSDWQKDVSASSEFYDRRMCESCIIHASRKNSTLVTGSWPAWNKVHMLNNVAAAWRPVTAPAARK
ncbi:hypothetical protein ANTRET_LOCUS5045 [Anthophora retusa]